MKADKIAHKHFPFLPYQTLLKVLSLALKYELSTEWTIVPGELSEGNCNCINKKDFFQTKVMSHVNILAFDDQR